MSKMVERGQRAVDSAIESLGTSEGRLASLGDGLIALIEKYWDWKDRRAGALSVEEHIAEIATTRTVETQAAPGSLEDGLNQAYGRGKTEVNGVELPREEVNNVKIFLYQSETFLRAGYNHMPERYGSSDGSISVVTMEDSRQYIIVAAKDDDSPYSAGHAAERMIDLRNDKKWVYAFDGDATIVAFTPDGEIETYSGALGSPSMLIAHTASELGRFVSLEVYPAEADHHFGAL